MKKFLLFLIIILSANLVFANEEIFLKCTYNEKAVYTKGFMPQLYEPQTKVQIYRFADNHIYTVDGREIGDVTDEDVAKAYFKYKDGDFIIIESFSVNRKTGAFINEKSIGTLNDLYIKSQGQGSCERTKMQNLF